MATFTLNVKVGDKIFDLLKEGNFKLCLAKRVNDTYNVVWSGEDFLSNNQFTWTEEYQVFGEKEFKDGALVKAATNAHQIMFGQTCVLQEDGKLLPATGTANTSGAFKVKDDYGLIHVGVNAKLNGSFQPIFVSPGVVSGVQTLQPINTVSVWFDTQLKTGTIFFDSKSDALEVVFEGEDVSRTVLYQQDGDKVGKGVWIAQ